MRYHVIGVAGCGKTTLARTLACGLSIPYLELDEYHWSNNWTRTPYCSFRNSVRYFTREKNWIIDGDYESVRRLIWHRIETVVWLDYPIQAILWRLAIRNVGYAMSGKNLWNSGSCENWRSLLGSDSILLRTLKKYANLRAKYENLMGQPEFSHIHFVHLRSTSETEQWLHMVTFSSTHLLSEVAVGKPEEISV